MSSIQPSVILHNGVIHTLNKHLPRAESLAVYQDRILALGSDDEIKRLAGPNTDVINLNDRTVLPGLTDAHIHLEQYAFAQERINAEVPSMNSCLEKVRQAVRQTEPGRWILGHGWNQNEWDRYGNTSDLDQVAPENPVYLTAKSLHAGWANSEALIRAGITTASPDPPGGHIQRDASGVPTGILFETAMEIMSEAVPEPSLDETINAIRKVQNKLWRYGITGLHDFDRSRCFQALQMLHKEHELGLRVIKNIPLDDIDHVINLGLRTGFGDDWIRVGNVKIFADGALGPRTAAMMEPYESELDNLGMEFYERDQLLKIFTRAGDGGLALSVHAIGDQAVHDVLAVFGELRQYESDKGLEYLPHRIEHLQLCHPDDLPHLVKHDIIASMQPIHATSDMDIANRYWGARVKHSYAWRTVLDAGATLAFGSDAPVESANPFWGLHAAITRQRRDGSPDKNGWIPSERLNLHEALLAYTHGPAKVARMSMITGQFVEGYMADLIVLDKDPYECPPEVIGELLPAGTMVGGKWRFREF
ncbi:MAG: amidohydrolase [Anaerolineaceae bacterium]|nr:MAG: amidohydrolase [Anaerolineaceae bacterium]